METHFRSMNLLSDFKGVLETTSFDLSGNIATYLIYPVRVSPLDPIDYTEYSLKLRFVYSWKKLQLNYPSYGWGECKNVIDDHSISISNLGLPHMRDAYIKGADK